MIKEFYFENLGPISVIDGSHLGKINLIVGENSVGKTFILKTLYSLTKSREEYGRGASKKNISEILSDKFYWTFQSESLSDIVKNGKSNKLRIKIEFEENNCLDFSFGHSTNKKIIPVVDTLTKIESNSIFLPPKDVLSIPQVVLRERLVDMNFGFDLTYSDLVLALQSSTSKNGKEFHKEQKDIEKIYDGKVEFDSKLNRWFYSNSNGKISIHITAEGIKKISMLSTLLDNGYIAQNSVVFIDELEFSLHPRAVVQLLDVIVNLAKKGVQFFISTHSYFVIKKLFLVTQNEGLNIPLFSPDNSGRWIPEELKDGIPKDNKIIDESIRLFEEELEASF